MTAISGITSFYQDIYPAAADSWPQWPKLQPAGEPVPGQPQPAPVDDAALSKEGKTLADRQKAKGSVGVDGKPAPEDKAQGGGKSSADGLTDDQKREVQKLQETDRQVRTHEQAHLAAGAGLAKGGATFDYETGPDGKKYAVGGEVQIDTSAERDPSATLRKAEQIKRAALAPADPSAQDRGVAASADAMAAKARQELANQQAGGGQAGGAGEAGGQTQAGAKVGGTAPAGNSTLADRTAKTHGAGVAHVTHTANFAAVHAQQAYRNQGAQAIALVSLSV